MNLCAHHLGNYIRMIFLFFGSSLAHLEPEPELFEVDDIGDDGDDDEYHYLPNFKQLYLGL